MKESRKEALRWLLQAENDLAFAGLGLREGYFAQVCFQCQQVSEKALKAIRYGSGERIVYGHSLVELAAPLNLPPELREDLAILDQYYIPTRYPNGLPGGVPYETYTRSQAQSAVTSAEGVVDMARSSLADG